MKFEEVKKVVGNTPFITDENARTLYDFIIKNKLTNCLELGFAYGVASCYMAAAIHELGGGKLTSVDLLGAKDQFKPSIEDFLSQLNLSHLVEIHRMETGYNWFLHDDIASASDNPSQTCQPKYDLCIIDGPKNWTIDSSAFFLADKLLKESGWMIFDDYNWSYEKADKKRESTDGITHRSLSERERILPQIKEVFHLLVIQHPNYSNFMIQADGDWAWAQKVKGLTKNISYNMSLKSVAYKKLSELTRKFKK